MLGTVRKEINQLSRQLYLTTLGTLSWVVILIMVPTFHSRFHTSYGWLHFWDWFHGTDVEFENDEIMKKRHVRLHTLKSARELVPGKIKVK